LKLFGGSNNGNTRDYLDHVICGWHL